jgi:hypothetical protein
MEAFDVPIINAVIKFNMDGEVIEAPRVMLNIATLEELTGDIVLEFGYPHKGLVP